MKFWIAFTLLTLISACTNHEINMPPDELYVETPFSDPPHWAQDAIWYQIFVERFRNGDPGNDPRIQDIQGSWPHNFAEDWKISPWTSDWFASDQNLPPHEFYSHEIQSRRYGGDLQGIFDKLDYLEDLGINAIYFNPLNDAPSLHKFDARNYRHIDINFGPDPDGDLAIIASEDPLDPSTWQWTSADKLFLKLIKELHQRDIKLIVDYSWNHTGITFWAWQDVLKNGKESKFAHWYEIEAFDNPETTENEFKYTGWAGVSTLPELKKVDVENRIHGKPYKGNIHPDVKQHIFNVTRRWLDPEGNGNYDNGIDGFRLDVADQIGLDFWRDYRKFVRSVNPDALLVGEIWWESWPDVMMDPMPYVGGGDIFDIVMFYQAYKPSRAFFAKTEEYGGAEKLIDELNKAVKGMSRKTEWSMMMMSASHDSPRLLTSFQNKGKYKVKAPNNELYQSGKPDPETYQRVKLYLSYQFTMPGAPQIWAGDEMGMWGGDDPDCRKPLWWEDLTFADETSDPYKAEKKSYPVGFNKELFNFYKKLIQLRKQHEVLRRGDFQLIHAQGDLFSFKRKQNGQEIVVILNSSGENIALPDPFKVQGKELLSGKSINVEPGFITEPLTAYIILEE